MIWPTSESAGSSQSGSAAFPGGPLPNTAAPAKLAAGVGKTPLLRELRLSTSPSTVEVVVEEEPAEAAEAAVAEAFDADVFRWSPEQSAAVQAPRSVKKPLAVVAAPTINTPRPGAQVQRSKPF